MADHPQTVCPMGPAPGPDSAGESQPSLGERQRRCDLRPPASTGTFKIWRKHSHTRASCASAHDSDNSSWRPLNQKFALVDAHISRISHAACTSGTTGMWSNNNFCSSDFFSKNRLVVPLECLESSPPARPRPMLSSLSTQLPRV